MKKIQMEDENGKRTRITLDLSERSYKRLNDLTALLEADSKASTLRQALQCFEYIARMSEKGASFSIHHPDGRSENIVFFLPVGEGGGESQESGALAAMR